MVERLRVWRKAELLSLCLLAALMWLGCVQKSLAQSRGEQYQAMGYAESGGWVPVGPSPSAVCTAFAQIWGWGSGDFSFATLQWSAGTWKCQRFYKGVPEPSQYAWIQGVCQLKPARLVTGMPWSHPSWDAGVGMCYCATTGRHFNRSVEWCDTAPAPNFMPDRDRTCRTKNPVSVSSGIKYQDEVDYLASSRLALVRSYAYSSPAAPPAPQVGSGWRLRLGASLEAGRQGSTPMIKVLSRKGDLVRFVQSTSGTWTATSIAAHRLIEGSGTGWTFYDADEGSLSLFDVDMRLLKTTFADGDYLIFEYSDTTTPKTIAPWVGTLIGVRDARGRRIDLRHTAIGVAQVAIPGTVADGLSGTSASPIRFAYDEAASLGVGVAAVGQLTSVTHPSGEVRRYLYEDPRFPKALTGIQAETGRRLSTYAYDGAGRVVDERLHAGAEGDVGRFQLDYSVAGQTTLTNPLGARYQSRFQNINGVNVGSGDTQPAGSGCAAGGTDKSYDADGQLVRVDGINGVRSCHVSDVSRGLELVAVEGLAPTLACSSVTDSGAPLPAGSRKTSLQWHPDWRLEIQRAEPGRMVTSVYNGQPDPFAGGAIARCAPSVAVLPDGKPIAVLCKRVEQATTDPDGGRGFAATLQAGVANRAHTYSYNERGQLLTAKGSRTDISDVTSYAYYGDTTADHHIGDLRSITNPSGKVTLFTHYDAHGQPLRSVDANGVVTDITYDLRQRIKSTSVAGETIRYDYHPTGELRRTTFADASFIEQVYDDAQRLVAVVDNRNNRIDYTLDSAGHRIAEKASDSAGALRRQMSRSMDALGRVQSTTGRP
jgi:YD repeat-containing protein